MSPGQQWLRWQFTRKAQQNFLQDLTTLIADGVSVSQALDAMQVFMQGASKAAAQAMASSIARGQTIAEGMQGWFANDCVDLVKVGETSGALLLTLQGAMHQLNEKDSALRLLATALLYPALVFLMACVVMVFVKHSVLDAFITMRPLTEWPALGKAVYWMASVIETLGWLIALIVILLALLVRECLANGVGAWRQVIDQWPVLAIYRQLLAARTLQTLGLLLCHGVVFREALNTLHGQNNAYLRWHISAMQRSLDNGQDNIAEVLDTRLLDRQDLLRLKVVASSKGFAGALTSLGLQAHQRNMRSIQWLSRIVVGGLLLISAAMAAVMVLAVYTVGSTVAIA